MAAETVDPLREERAQRILETTIELAEQGGFEAVRLRDVAAHAEVAMGTLYRRFSSKEDLLVAALELETRAMAVRVEKMPSRGDTPSERVVNFFGRATRGMLRRPNLSRAMLRAVAVGEPALAQKVGVFHDLMLRMTLGALRGASVAIDDPRGLDEFSQRERLRGEVLNQIWFAMMLGWAGGSESQNSIHQRMCASVELVSEEHSGAS